MAVVQHSELLTINEVCRQLRSQGLPLMPQTLTILVQLGFITLHRVNGGLNGLRPADVNRFLAGTARKERVEESQ